jgi:hypothetical protein
MNIDPSDVAALLARLRRGQQQQRLMLFLVFALFLGLLVFVLLNQQKRQATSATTDSITAGLFELVDHNGAQAAMLSNGRQGPLLTMSKGKAQAEFRLVNRGPVLSMVDAGGNLRATLAAPDSTTELRLFDEAGNVRASLAVTKSESDLSLADDKGKVRIKMSVKGDGPQLEFFDANGKLISSKP